MTIKLGIVGLRNNGMAHGRRVANLDGVEVIAGADLDEKRQSEAKKELGLAHVYADADELFANPEVDAVVLSLPNHLHAPMSMKALRAGKHVLVEKPIANSTAVVDDMIKARDESGKVFMVGYNQRFSPDHYACRDVIRSGKIGDVYMAEAAWNHRRINAGLFQRGPWFLSMKTAGGGPMVDLGIHKLDLLLFLLDFPEVASVTGTRSDGLGKAMAAEHGHDYGIEDNAMGLARLKNGGVIKVEASYFNSQPELEYQNIVLRGSKGFILERAERAFENPGDELPKGLRKNEYATIVDGEVKPFELEPVVDAPTSCVDHFTRVIRGDEELASTAEEARLGLKIVEAIYQSAETGREVVF